jgi:hypothetical protein
MSRRSLKTEDEEGFLRAYRDEVLDTQSMYQVHITCDVRVGVTPARLVLHLTATGDEGGPLEGVTTHVEYLYPSITANRLHAALYQAGIRINVAVQREYRDRHGHYLSEHT